MSDLSIESAICRSLLMTAPDTSVQAALTCMVNAKSSYILVVETLAFGTSRLIGLLTEPMVLQLVAAGTNLAECPVQTAMSQSFMTLHEAELTDQATVLQRCREASNTPIPIIDAHHHPVGIMTQSQMVNFLHHALQEQAIQNTAHQQTHRTLQASLEQHQQGTRAIKRQLQRALRLQQITDAIHAQLDPAQMFTTAATLVGRMLGASRCIICTYTAAPVPQVLLVAEYVESSYPAVTGRRLSLANNPYIERVLSQEHALASDNVYAEPLLETAEPLFQQIGLRSMLTVRTVCQGQPNGILTIQQCDRFRQWSENEVKLFESTAVQLGIALAQANLLEQEKQQRTALDQQNTLLQQQIRERQRIERDLRKSEERWQLVIQAINGGVFDVDLTTGRTFHSTRWKEMLGYAEHEISDSDSEWFERIHPDDSERVSTANDALYQQTAPHFIQEYRLRCKDDSYIWVLDRSLAVWDEAGNPIRVVGVLSDISDRKATEAALARRERYLTALVEIQRQLLASRKGKTAYDQILQWLGLVSGASRVYLFENHFDAAGNMLMSQRAEWCGEGIKPEIGNPTLQNLSYNDFFPRWASTLARGETINGVVAEFPEAERVILEPQGIRSILILPLVVKHEFWGFIGFDNCLEARPWNPLEISLLSAAASAISIHQDRQRTEQALQLIVEGTAAKTGNEFFQSLVRYLAEVLQVRYAFVTQLIKPAQHRVRTLAFWTGDGFGENFEYDLVDTPCADILTNEIIYYRDSIQSRFPHHKHLVELGVESYFGVPLNDSVGNIIGHLKVLDVKPLMHDQTSEQILRIFAARAGAELERQQAENALSELLTQTQQQSLELGKARDAAETANRAKSEFLANMSHELRTPLNAILGFAQVISHDSCLSPEHREYINIINRSGQHLLALINDVLEMSKIESGRATLHPTNFDLYLLLGSLQEMLNIKASAKRLTLTFNCDSDVPRYVTTDESKLRQVLLNLLGNAVKFTEAGRVMLRVWRQARAEGRSPTLTLGFEVEDTGPGIAAAEMPQLFKPFVQTRTGQQSSEGTGLGLAISRTFVQLMGGDITVTSQVGRGSLFRFQIQVQLAQALTVPVFDQDQWVTGLEAGQPTYRLLIVEDRWENSQVLVKLLEPVGFVVQVATNGQEAIAIWEAWEPHLIWMDMRMPVMNGYEATKRIKATSKGRSTVIIAITSSAFEESRTEILESGCDDFVRKPFQTNVIFAKLNEHLGVRFVFGTSAALTPSVPGQERQPATTPIGILGPRVEVSSDIRSHSETETNGLLPADTDAVLHPTALQVMPESWIRHLRQAAIEGRDRRLLELIQQIPGVHIHLANALETKVYGFNFQEIVALTQSFDS